MLTTDLENADLWFAQKQVVRSSGLRLAVPDLLSRSEARLSSFKAAKVNSMARSLVGALWDRSPAACMVLVVEHDIWPSSEHLPLFYSWRKSLGLVASLTDAPGHEFNIAERDEMTSLVFMSLCFGWGLLAGDSDCQMVWTFSHDDLLKVYAVDSTAPQQLIKTMSS